MLSTPVTGIDSTLNYENGRLTVNLEGIFSRTGAMTATSNRVDMKRPEAPIFFQHGSLMLDLDEFSALNVIRTGLTLLLKPNSALEQDATGLKLLCASPLAIESNVLKLTQSRCMLKGRGIATSFNNYGNLFANESFPYTRTDYGLPQDRSSVASSVKCLQAKTVKITVNVTGAGGKVVLATEVEMRKKILANVSVGNEYYSTTILHDFVPNEVCMVLCTEINAYFAALSEEVF